MPSGIDAALKSLKADAMMPVPTKVRAGKVGVHGCFQKIGMVNPPKWMVYNGKAY